jgi:uncharacterized protein
MAEAMRTFSKQVDLVVVTSKLCNLRCSYCYEYPDLGDKTRMSIAQLERLFIHVADYYRSIETPTSIRFAWHGGEPLLIPPEYYRKAFELQRAIFAGWPHEVKNYVQTNLTVLDDDRIALLRDEFDGVGVSLDLFSGLRVNKAGVCQEDRTLKNMDRAFSAGVQLGAITVLSKKNLPFVRQIYQFYRTLKMGFRLLPLHRGPYEQGQGIEITAQETLDAMCELADLWFEDDQLVRVQPLLQYMEYILHAHRAQPPEFSYDKSRWESIILFDVDGKVGGYNDAFDATRSYGNIFENSLSEILASERHRRVVAEAAARMKDTCTGCPYFKKMCTGYPIAEGGQEFIERDRYGVASCVYARGLIQHLERRFVEAGIS